MALLDESNLLAERARHAKFRTNHVGTKLNEAELHELGELVAKRKETPVSLATWLGPLRRFVLAHPLGR
jgi:hypothetical protein